MSGARYEIAIAGKLHIYRDDEEAAFETAREIKRRNPHAGVTVRNLEGGETIAIKSPTAVK